MAGFVVVRKARSLAKGARLNQTAEVPRRSLSGLKLENVKIVMVGTTHPGNVGAAARAMFNMGIERLCLVDPQCPIGEVAYARASGANAILDRRETRPELKPAVADCHLVVAASARRRALAWPESNPRRLAKKILGLGDDARVALVFGREHSGLTNEEIQMCHRMVCIPTNPAFSSLNVAAAIQVLCYELYSRLASAETPKIQDPADLPASSAELEAYFEHLREVLEATGFYDPDRPGQVLQRLRRLYLRSEPSRNEINILRGMLSAVQKQR